MHSWVYFSFHRIVSIMEGVVRRTRGSNVPTRTLLGRKDTVNAFKTLWNWAREVQNMTRLLRTDHIHLPAAEHFGSPSNFVRGDK